MLWLHFLSRYHVLRYLLLVFCVTGCAFTASSQTEKFIQLLTGPITKGDTCTVTDDKFTDANQWSHIEKQVDVSNVVTFEMRFDTSLNYFSKSFSCVLEVDIDYLKADHSPASLKNISLGINYDTAYGSRYKAIAWYRFTGGHQVKLTVKKISSPQLGNRLPPVFRVKNEIFIDRRYVLSGTPFTHIAAVSKTGEYANARKSSNIIPGRSLADAGGQQVLVNWEVSDPPYPEYDFEWAYCPLKSVVGTALTRGVFSFSPADLESVFFNNSSRVTVRLPQYQLNLVYPAGWIFHRVRGVRYDEPSGERTEGPWSYQGSFSFNNSGYGVIRIEPHEENFNWQYTRLFAEQGKQQERIQYFDGSLRERQEATLRNDNSGTSTIVEETIPDASGRPALHVLPAPTEEATLHFFHGFNVSSLSGKPYSYRDFDRPGFCATAPGPMDNSSGAAKYYSSSNPRLTTDPNQGDFTRYLPDAAGYPYAFSGYTPDNTGRYSVKGGVGSQFQPGKAVPRDDHNTHYFYGKPQQYELDRLFGNEAGNASHYSKLLTTDPNGQSAVTYFNMAGQTIATAIAGARPENLQALPTYTIGSAPIKTDLISDDDFVRDPATLSITCNSSFLSASPGDAMLKFSFVPMSLQVLYGIENAKICATCFYDMSIAVTDGCGNPVGIFKKDAVFTEETGCTPAPAAVEGEFPVTFSAPGSYNISFKLQLSSKAIDFYTQEYLLQDTSLKKEVVFEKDFIHRADLSACFSNCATCLANLGAEAAFTARLTGMLQSAFNLPLSAADSVWITDLYHQLLDSCTAMQLGCGNTSVPCGEETLLMKEDLTPGGQYMHYDENLLIFTERDLNAYLVNRNALIQPVTINGETKPFNQWEEPSLISNWQDEWTNLLLPYHPENPGNCLIESCLQLAEAEKFGQRLLNTEDVGLAAASHFWFTDNFIATVDRDPYFISGAPGAAQKLHFISQLNNFRGTGLDIMSFIRWRIYCAKNDTASLFPVQLVSCPRSAACNREQDEWNLFRVLYFSARQELSGASNCSTVPQFSDPLAALPALPGQPPAPAPCPDTRLFDIITNNGVVTLRYNGSMATAAVARLHYLAVNARLELVTDAAGFIDIPAGTLPGVSFVLPARSGLRYIADYSRCDAVHPYAGKLRRDFGAVSLAAAINSIQLASPVDLNQNALAVMQQGCTESCALYADGWMQKLSGCSLDQTDSLYFLLRQGLLAVCNKSCSLNVDAHPFGESTTAMPDSFGDSSFRDVLLRVLGENRLSALCNDLWIDFPFAHQQAVVPAPVYVRTLAPCAYALLVDWKKAYDASKEVGNFSGYIRAHIDSDFYLSDEEIRLLMTAFENNCFAPRPLLLPASLNCADSHPVTCLTCAVLDREKKNFAGQYGFIAASDPAYPVCFAGYINKQYGFSVGAEALLAAFDKCRYMSDTVSLPPDCESLQLACRHFAGLRPGYAYLSKAANEKRWNEQLIQWLNIELNLDLDLKAYQAAAQKCQADLPVPFYTTTLACDSEWVRAGLPRVLTCCEPSPELEKVKAVFPDSVNARLLAFYFSMVNQQPEAALNLPVPDINWAYDSIAQYFRQYRIAQAYQIVITPDSLLSVRADSAQFCHALAVDFGHEPAGNPRGEGYALCNKPLFPLLETDSNACIRQQFNTAVTEGKRYYLSYMEQIKRDYREAYYLKCLSVRPALTLEGNTRGGADDHITLYYYDQSGNLVKTIPPAGVRAIDAGDSGQVRMARVKNARRAERTDCYEFSDAPAFDGRAKITVAGNSIAAQVTKPFTVETFISFSDLNSDQLIVKRESVNGVDGNTDGFRIYYAGGRLRVDYAAHGKENWIQRISKITNYPWPDPYAGLPAVKIRTIDAKNVPRSIYRKITAEVSSPLNSLLKPGEWIHLATVFTGDRSEPLKIYVNGSQAAVSIFTASEIWVPAAAPPIPAEDIAAGASGLDFKFDSFIDSLSVSNNREADLVVGAANGGLNGGLKQVRLYNRMLAGTELRQNAFNRCTTPHSTDALVIWLPLNREETAGISADQANQIFTVNEGTVFSAAYQPVYPAHFLPTTYVYNSLEAVTRQVTPDGGEVNFYHDLAGRLVGSQNAEQKKSTRGEADNRYSYNRYDAAGRVIETGEKSGAAPLSNDLLYSDPADYSNPLYNWLASGHNAQVIQTIYDTAAASIVNNITITANQQLYTTARKRITSTLYRDNATDPGSYNNGTHYQYDISGNIKTLWQENKSSVTGQPVNLLKEIHYSYDLLSGKVNSIRYQDKKGDQFRYAFSYDPGNRLLSAFSGRQANLLQQDAAYRYYLHGPLARVELGDALSNRIVQGIDYVYTLQGWLKGVNGVMLPAVNLNADITDAGADGTSLSSGGYHAQAGQDRLSFSLGYYSGDYKPIGSEMATAFKIAYAATGTIQSTGNDLYNGNIRTATYSIGGISNGQARGYSYGYDQLDRLKELRAHDLTTALSANTWNNSTVIPDNSESFGYDGNGNITALYRNGTTAGGRTLGMDNQDFHYYYFTPANIRRTFQPGSPLPADAWAITNQLAHIKDAVPAGNYPGTPFPNEKDIDSQAPGNYDYDGTGNLVQDKAEGITKIGWTAYGKISRIDKKDGSIIIYDYDAAGNRVMEQVTSGGQKTLTNYIRDVLGNTLAVYTWQGKSLVKALPVAEKGNGLTGQFWSEQVLYALNRLGTWKPAMEVPSAYTDSLGEVIAGSKWYELSNHLGNVMAVISDKKLAVSLPGKPGVTDHYAAELISSSDYTAFGMPMAGRTYTVNGLGYRYGFNGKENDDAVKGPGSQQDYGMRIYDPRVGRFLSTDPISKSYPGLTPYQFASDRPIEGIDLDGLEFFKKDNTNYILPYRTVFNAPNFQTAVRNAVLNTGNFITNSTAGVVMQTAREINNYFAEGYRHQSEFSPVQQFVDFTNNQFRYITTTSGRQQLEDLAATASNLKTYELPFQLLIAHKLSFAESEFKYHVDWENYDNFLEGKFAQPSHSNNFSDKGRKELGIISIDQAIENLTNGAWTPKKLPIDYVVRNGQVYFINTRSSVSLLQANINRSEWFFRNQTGIKLFEEILTNNLQGSKGFKEVINRQTKVVTKMK